MSNDEATAQIPQLERDAPALEYVLAATIVELHRERQIKADAVHAAMLANIEIENLRAEVDRLRHLHLDAFDRVSSTRAHELHGHALTLLAIIDSTGGFMSPTNQEAIRAARKAVGL